MSVNHYRKLELFGFWGDDVGWWCIVQLKKQKAEHLCCDVLLFMTAPPILVQPALDLVVKTAESSIF